MGTIEHVISQINGLHHSKRIETSISLSTKLGRLINLLVLESPKCQY